MCFWRKPTVESIIAPITDIVDKLKSHAAVHFDKADEHDALADEHSAKAQAASQEAAKATTAAEKIAGLVS